MGVRNELHKKPAGGWGRAVNVYNGFLSGNPKYKIIAVRAIFCEIISISDRKYK